jgi:hypothetical protein
MSLPFTLSIPIGLAMSHKIKHEDVRDRVLIDFIKFLNWILKGISLYLYATLSSQSGNISKRAKNWQRF